MINQPLVLFDKYSQSLDELKVVYAGMDQAYAEIADAYGFHCTGCADNCCLTRFFHHTLVEFLFLRKGLADLDEMIREEIRCRAAEVNEQVCQAETSGQVPRVMCPLNSGGLCLLYEYRPMICRLHGIPHEFVHPVQNKIVGPGCDEFVRQSGRMAYLAFDRTVFYRQMAMLERRVREISGSVEKFKRTVAQMLLEDTEKFL